MQRRETTTTNARRFLVAWIAVAFAGALGIAAFVALAPGKTGAAGVKICALCMLAALVALAYTRSLAAYPDGGRDSFGEALDSCGSASRNLALAAAALAFAAGFACCLGATLAQTTLAVETRFALGMAGTLASVLAIVTWSKSAGRQLALHDPSDPKRPLARKLGVRGAFCAALFLAGLAPCAGMSLTPLTDPGIWGASAGGLLFAATCACGLVLFHKPKSARQLDDMQGRLIEVAQEKDAYREQANTMASEMADLREKHEDALQANKQLNATVRSMRRERLEAAPAGGLDASCAAIIRDFKLSKREGEVLALLAHGRSRKRIADELLIEPSTVSTHVARLYRRLNVHSNQELIDYVKAYR